MDPNERLPLLFLLCKFSVLSFQFSVFSFQFSVFSLDEGLISENSKLKTENCFPTEATADAPGKSEWRL